MKQIYNFERVQPPIVNERLLKKEIERREIQRRTLILTFATILFQIVVVLFGVIVSQEYPIISAICYLYLGGSTLCSGVIAVVFVKKGRALL